MSNETLLMVIALLLLSNVGTWLLVSRMHWNSLKYTGLLPVYMAAINDMCRAIQISAEVDERFQARFNKLSFITERYRERIMGSSSTRD